MYSKRTIKLLAQILDMAEAETDDVKREQLQNLVSFKLDQMTEEPIGQSPFISD